MLIVQLVIIIRSGCLTIHLLLTIHRLIRVSVSVRVSFRVRVRDMVKRKVIDHIEVTVGIRIRL